MKLVLGLRTGAVCAAALFVAGCASTWSSGTVDRSPSQAAASGKPTEAGKVTVSEADMADRKYTSLGDIAVTVNKLTVFSADPTTEQVNQKLREKAAELGADAVVLVRYGKVGVSALSYGSLEGKGRAVKTQP